MQSLFWTCMYFNNSDSFKFLFSVKKLLLLILSGWNCTKKYPFFLRAILKNDYFTHTGNN